MHPQHEFDYSVPFDIMVGLWTGVTIIYGPTGEFFSSAASNVAIYWEKPNEVMHFRQGKEEAIAPLTAKKFASNLGLLHTTASVQNKKAPRISALLTRAEKLKDPNYLKKAATVATTEFDLHVSGKFATASTSDMDVTGINSRPDTYLFYLRLKDGSMSWCNNQYFTNANERQIIGPQFDADEVQLVVAQTFSRVSYEVPEAMKRPIQT